MPLKGEAKRLYQREYMKEYMGSRRAVKTLPVKTPTDVKTLLRPENEQKRLAEARVVLHSIVRPKTDAPQSTTDPFEEDVRHIIPYKPGTRYKPGTELVLPSGEIVTAPELDAEGNPIW